MKTMCALTTALLISVLASASEVSVGWNESPPMEGVASYRIYELTPDGLEMLDQVSGTRARIDVPDSGITIVATAINAQGIESDPSAPLEISGPPTPPEGLRVIVTIELSNNAE